MDWPKSGSIRVSPCPLRTPSTWKPATRPSRRARRTVPRVPRPSETNGSRALVGAKSGAGSESPPHSWSPALLYPYRTEFKFGDFAIGVERIDGQEVGSRLLEVEGQKHTSTRRLV